MRERARAYPARHPRSGLIVVSLLLAAAVSLFGAQLVHGTYLGRGWVVAGVAGMVTAVGLNAAVWASNRRHRPAAFPLNVALLVLGTISASAIRMPFPQGPYGHVMALFIVVHAAMLGFAVVTGTGILAIMAYALLRPRSAARRREAHTG